MLTRTKIYEQKELIPVRARGKPDRYRHSCLSEDEHKYWKENKKMEEHISEEEKAGVSAASKSYSHHEWK